MNDTEKDRIAAAVNAMRPDWPLRSVRTVLDSPKLAHRPRRDVAVAFAWIACEAESKTPARVHENGPWWSAANIENSSSARPPKKHEACETCGRRQDDHGTVAWLADHPFTPLDHANRNRSIDGAAIARAELRRPTEDA